YSSSTTRTRGLTGVVVLAGEKSVTISGNASATLEPGGTSARTGLGTRCVCERCSALSSNATCGHYPLYRGRVYMDVSVLLATLAGVAAGALLIWLLTRSRLAVLAERDQLR